ncbi:hypothetical protein GCM10011584_01040 [Nocardioides phosphati]|uniref:GmrSD restriction endonucleases C-terminal domain-containing protein n=1 Tax=Nocardioides phosphati TaxID=1867775 RepID=A0ABQ2N737_9ACTN|nr:HNH endonuclease family protein [Nocardioides phosphati]GGO84155.1 hypothetical protein GCM10011584_01040 [Nocardioides phosphati]
MKDSTFVAGGVLVAALIGYSALHQPASTVAAPERPAASASTQPSIWIEPTPTPSTTPTHPTSPYAAKLAGLTVAPRVHRTDYDRDAFGSSWRDTDHNGCNQRDDVLVRDAIPGSVTVGRQGSCDHDVLAGSWLDPYTGRRIDLTDAKAPDQAQAVQIDHVVPLSEAWSSGAWRWPAERRAEFANDLGELLAVDGPTNASKGDDDPAAWRPRKAYQCTYARRWITVKAAWHLDVDASERRALEEMLGFC